MPFAAGFREEAENVKIWFLSRKFMANVGAPPEAGGTIQEHDEHMHQIWI